MDHHAPTHNARRPQLRRTTSGSALGALALAALVSCALLALVACGGTPTPSPTVTVTVSASGAASPPASPAASPTPTAAAPVTVTLYLVRDGRLAAVQRTVPGGQTPAEAALVALFRGPTVKERAGGMTSAVPRGVKVLDVAPASGGGTSVGISSRFARAGATTTVRLRMAQMVYTVAGAPRAGQPVRLRVDDEQVFALPTDDGETAYSPTRHGYVDLEPTIFVTQPAWGASVRSPLVLTGSASVFEGTFAAELLDAGGHMIAKTAVQASAGAPGRGRFRKSLAFTTSAARGTLVVYDQSMEDGSRQDEVRVPVTFAK